VIWGGALSSAPSPEFFLKFYFWKCYILVTIICIHWPIGGGIAAVSPSKYALVQRHCTNNNVTYLQSQQQLQLEQSCSVIVERCLEQHRFYLSPERSVRFSSSDRRRQSIPGPRSGHWKCSIAKCNSSCGRYE